MEQSTESLYLRSVDWFRKFSSKVLGTKLIVMRNERAIVSFTFDGVPRSAITTGARILENHGACGTFYVAGSLCGRELNGTSYFRAEDLPDLVRAGHEIGSHTFNYTAVTALNRAALERENAQNDTFVTDKLPNYLLCNFAYPSGKVGPKQKIALQHRFASCRSTEAGIHVRVADLGLLRAFRLSDAVVDREMISGLIDQTVKKNGWLIFHTHKVDDCPTEYGCRAPLFEYAVQAALNHRADILTIRNAIGAIAYGDS